MVSMNNGKMKEWNHSTRRGFVKTVAAGGAVMAVAGTLMDWTAHALPAPQNVSTDTSDGKTKYGKCLVELPIHKMGDMSMFSAGADILNGFPCNIIYAFGVKAGPLGLSTEPHVHDHDEVIYFIGSEPKDIGDLGAEVNFMIGPKGQEEDHVFSVPTAVVIPKGVWHCPMVTLKFEKPFLCMAVSLTTKYEFHYSGKE
ncbi:MAG: twin-arginine translocation signal domain-containing protein [Deltaproteobacteria bacterium]|nr:twin-arginine translocation signal domain-containing protein [Deltaproteobacteria bacterium]